MTTERIIQNALARHYHAKGYPHLAFNIYAHKWESDFLTVSATDLSTEVEIKCTRSDFLRDKLKGKFQTLFTGFFNHRHPNYFLYACPIGMIKLSELPRHAGLIYVASDGSCEIIKRPKVLHRSKVHTGVLLHMGRSCANFLVGGL